jgi:hypothetical protein
VKAFRVGVPIIGYQTADAEHSLQLLVDEFDKFANPPAVLSWDCVEGLRGRNSGGKQVVAQHGSEHYSIVDALQAVQRVESRVIVVVLNAHLFLGEPTAIQVLANVRDDFKASLKQVILFSHALVIPAELQHDVVTFHEALPTCEQLQQTVKEVIDAVEWPTDNTPTDETLEQVASAVVGLTAFAAENVASMAISKQGISLNDAWSQKKAKINATAGLQWIDGTGFGWIGGCAKVKELSSKIMLGSRSPSAIVFIDEIEKALAGSQSDTSGVSTDQLGCLLSWMQDHSATGMIFVGPPGAAKSAMAKAIGGEHGKPTIQLDLGSAKGSLVGESEQKIREALRVIDAVAGGRQTLWIATCNSLSALPPELRRRFKLGTWFFDLPSLEDRKAIWAWYGQRYSVQISEDVLSHELTGAEIESVCDIADRTGLSVSDALQFIVPVARSASEWLRELRESANGKLLDAHRGGVYAMQGSREPSAKRRKFE